MPNEPNRLLGTNEACKILGVSLATLYQYIKEGKLPAVKLGLPASKNIRKSRKHWKIRASDLDDFVSGVHFEL